MALEIAVKHKKCDLCKKRRAQRYCLRYGKEICWVCCNGKRIDKKCPNECGYKLQGGDEDSAQLPRVKVDSYSEHMHLLDMEIDIWAEVPQKLFNDRIPSEMAATSKGRDELDDYVKSISKLPPRTISYLRRRLHLPRQDYPKTHYEEIAMIFLDKIIEQDWEATIEFMADNGVYENELYRNNYLKRRSNNNLLKRMKSYELILSALADTGKEALAFFEINGKYDLTMNFIREEENWRIKSLFLGSPHLYYGASEVENQIISVLSQNKLDETYDKLKKSAAILIDSAEIFYLFGIYWAIKEDYQKANEMFLSAVEICPTNYDYRYNYAFTLQSKGEPAAAKSIYEDLMRENPTDLKILNNLAVIYLLENEIGQAKDIWKKCLEIDEGFEPALKNLERFGEVKA